jgi:hypothetical protein
MLVLTSTYRERHTPFYHTHTLVPGSICSLQTKEHALLNSISTWTARITAHIQTCRYNMATQVPAGLKTADITRFVHRASQLENAKPIVAYWCMLGNPVDDKQQLNGYQVNTGLSTRFFPKAFTMPTKNVSSTRLHSWTSWSRHVYARTRLRVD